jgi:ATP-dependent RNA helicase RhlE
MTFNDLNLVAPIQKALKNKGYVQPTPIQEQSIPFLLQNKDLLGSAQTGTGKTAAFAIPIIQHIYNNTQNQKGKRKIRALVVTPTRELAIQIAENFTAYAKHTGLRNTVIFGGVKQASQVAQLRQGVDILVATPGRLLDLMGQGIISLRDIRYFVLDEADHMLDLGFIKDINDLIRFLPKKRQTLFFSATINPKIKKLAYSLVNKPIRIQVSPKNPVAKNIDHKVAFIEMDDKRAFLERLVNENPEAKILVFVRTKVRAERVKKAMERVEIKSETIHSDKEQKERSVTLDRFKRGYIKLLIATDVSARGIDIPSVDFVVNYDLPEVAENYVHRVGRTGRGKKKGQAVAFCSTDEKEILTEIEEFLGKEIAELEIEKDSYRETLDFTKDTDYNWKKLIRENEKEVREMKKKRKK